MRSARTIAVLGAMAAGSLGLALLAFGTHDAAFSAPAQSAANNGPDLTALPLGDGRSTTAGARRGYLYVCRAASDGPAAGSGPWIHGSTYDLSAKSQVDGAISWPSASFRKNVSRALLKLSAACTTGEVGIARNGVAIFNAVDAAGQDAVAHEVQDACSGHPQQSGVYHYHGLPACVSPGTGRKHSKLIGWALDGFPIYGPLGNKGVYMRTSDLDACHGHTHVIAYQGERRRLFHYHATAEFPYTVGCFRGDPVTLNTGGGGATPPSGPPDP